jgi:arabinofuranosyltransferase
MIDPVLVAPTGSMKRLLQVSRRTEFHVGASLVLFWVGVMLHACATHGWGVDDAFITFRYALNLVEGHGPVYNPGEPAVEGYSSPLYLLISTAGIWLGGRDAVFWVVTVVSAVCGSLTLVLLSRLTGRRFGPKAQSSCALILALNPVLWAWSASGLESVAFLTLQVSAWICVDSIERVDSSTARRFLALIMVLVVITRVDGFVTCTICVLFLLLRRRHKAAGVAFAAMVAALIAVTAWRLFYYGFALPNTFYAKATNTPITRLASAFWLLARMAISQVALIPVATVLACWIVTGLRLRDAGSKTPENSPRVGPTLLTTAVSVPFAAFLGLGLCSYWIYIGGDHFRERMLLFLYVATFPLLLWMKGDRLNLRIQQSHIATGLIGLQMIVLVMDPRFSYAHPKQDGWTTLGYFLRERHPDATLAIDAAGKVPFYSGLRTLDFLGLNDRYIARLPVRKWSPGHGKFDPEYVLRHSPDLICSWVDPELNFSYGLVRPRYEAHGYVLAYLVSTNVSSGNRSVVLDVSMMDRATQSTLILSGFRYGVLRKRASTTGP